MKQFLNWQLCLAIWLGIASLSCAQNKATFELAEDEKLIEFTTDRFTLPNLHVTPDGRSIIFDVLGDIYQVPIEGGKAEALLQDNNWKRAGKLSPDGKTLAYISDESGEFQVWTMDLETQEKRVYPNVRKVNFSNYAYWDYKGNLLIPENNGLRSFKVDKAHSSVIKTLEGVNLFKGEHSTITIGGAGRYVYFREEGLLKVFDLLENKKTLESYQINTTSSNRVYFDPNGSNYLYYNKSSEIPVIQELKVKNIKTGKEKVLQTSKKLGYSTNLNYSFDFINENTIVLDKEGEIVRMDIETGEYDPIPIEVEVKKVIKKPLRREPQYIRDSIITASVLRNPITRKDLDTIYFGAFGKLHSYAKETEVITEIYPEEDRFEVSPSLSPDGKYLAYTTWNDTEMGHVFAREIKTGKEYQLTKTAGRYINPAWSPDGTEVVFVADETEAKLGIPKQLGGPNSLNYHLDLHKLKVFKSNEAQELSQTDTIYRVQSAIQLSRRFYPIPIYHPSGKSIFITTRNQEKDLPVLIELDLNTKEISQERLIPFHTDEVLVSPNAAHIAFIFDEQVWIDTFPFGINLEFNENSEFIPEKYHYKGGFVDNILLPKTRSVYEVAPSYLYWQDENTLMWGSAEEVFTYDVRTRKTEKIADIQVQKPRAVPKTQYALTNARIITMNKQDEIIEKGTILVKDNRIEAVGEKVKIPENYKVFDLGGKTIMPGLIDVHAHYHISFPFEILPQENYAYKGNLAYGVTTIYDPSVNVLDYREQAQMVETGKLLGPRVFASGNIILTHPTRYDFKTLKDIKDANRLIQSLLKLSVHGPIKEYGSRKLSERILLRQSSSDNNITITAHQDDYINAISRITNGYSAIEHQIGTFSMQFDLQYLIGKSQINYTPTAMVSPGITNVFAENTIKEKEKLLKCNGELLYHNNYAATFEYQDKERQSIVDNWSRAHRHGHPNFIYDLKKINDYGGKISIGGHGNPLPGIGTHWEIWFINESLTNYESLQAATRNGAEKLDLQEEIGSIEIGKLADILVLNENPLDDIFNTTDILYTIKNGNIFDVDSMNQVHSSCKK